MNIHKIRTEAEYRAALKEASALVDSDPALEVCVRPTHLESDE